MRARIVAPTFIAFCLILIMSQSVLADGVFMVVKGDIKVVAKGKGPVAAKVGMKVQASDKIIAGADGRAKIVMVDKNVLNISPKTELVVETYKFNEAKDEKNVSLNVIYGKVRATVNQKYDGEKNKFQVKTPSAVAGVRGTDFLTSHNRQTNESRVVTFHGAVVVGTGVSASGEIANPVVVPAGSFSVAANDGPPTPPAPVPARELQAMNRETSTDGGRPPVPDRMPAQENGEGPNGEKSEGGPSGPKPGAPGAPGPGGAMSPADSEGPVAGEPLDPLGPRDPAAVDSTQDAPLPPPPIMIDPTGDTLLTEVPPMMEFNPPLEPIYIPPTVPQDIIQQNTNLTVNINVQ